MCCMTCYIRVIITGDLLYTVHSTAEGDRIYVTDLTSNEQRLMTMMSSHIVGQLSMFGNYLYFYSYHERR